MPVHPAAAVFPMLPPVELQELVEDIKANGLQHPLVVKSGQLIDGRNRREACKIAGILPQTVELNGQDPTAYVLSSNIARRHMTKGQRAMAVAMLYPEPTKYRRGGANAGNTPELDKGYLSHARTVLKWAPELADAVLHGAQSLDTAYAVAQDRKAKAEAPQRRLDALRVADTDLADKVVEGDLNLDDAEAAARGRRERERADRQGLYDGLRAVEAWKFLFSGKNLDYLVRVCREHPDELKAATVVTTLDELTDLFAAAKKELSA